jgi:uncharacterized membrane protein
MNETIIAPSFAPEVLDMNRYNQAKDKKSAWRGILGMVVLIALASVGWFYFKNQQSDAVTGGKRLSIFATIER